MTPPEEWKDQNPQRRQPSFVQIATIAVIAALLGAVVAFLMMRDDDEDPDRPPIIVRNGSVIVTERLSPLRGELKHASGKTWYHEHAHKGPKRLNAFVVGIANNSCGNGVTNFVSNVKKAMFTYTLGGDTWNVELLPRNKRIEVDVISGPDPTNLDKWTLSFGRDAILREVLFNGAEKCVLDAGGYIELTQHN